MALEPVPRLLLVVAGVLVVLAIAWQFLPWKPFRLPGDFTWGKGSVRVYFPLGTSILVSVVLTLLLWLFSRSGGR
jgi:hypothetical protein